MKVAAGILSAILLALLGAVAWEGWGNRGQDVPVVEKALESRIYSLCGRAEAAFSLNVTVKVKGDLSFEQSYHFPRPMAESDLFMLPLTPPPRVASGRDGYLCMTLGIQDADAEAITFRIAVDWQHGRRAGKINEKFTVPFGRDVKIVEDGVSFSATWTRHEGKGEASTPD